MRLELRANSKKKITYLPNYLILENNNDKIKFDITGNISYGKNKLNCYIKGDFQVVKGNNLINMNAEHLCKLIRYLDDPDSKITVVVYPEDEDVYVDDVLSDCEGTIELYLGNNSYVNSFNFEVQVEEEC